jgi:hypothetical protein
VKEFTRKEFEGIFRAAEVVKQNIMDADSNLDRSLQIRRDVDKAFCFYQHVLVCRFKQRENNPVYAAEIFRKKIKIITSV